MMILGASPKPQLLRDEASSAKDHDAADADEKSTGHSHVPQHTAGADRLRCLATHHLLRGTCQSVRTAPQLLLPGPAGDTASVTRRQVLHLIGGGRWDGRVYGADEILAAVFAILRDTLLLDHLLHGLHATNWPKLVGRIWCGSGCREGGGGANSAGGVDRTFDAARCCLIWYTLVRNMSA